MIWYVLTAFIVITILLDIYTLAKSKPSFKSALKMTFNMHIEIMLAFWWLHLILVWLLMYMGIYYLQESSSNIVVLTMAGGIKVSLYMIIISYMGILFYGIFRKRDKELWNWVDRIKIEGIWKYTEVEKEYNKAQDIKSKEQIRRWFPFIKKFDKKVV
jgi:hypothetical protein